MSDGILGPLIFTYLDVCVECIKENPKIQRRYDTNRSLDVLEILHIDIYGPFPIPFYNGQLSFIMFIENYFRYGYIYPIHKRLNDQTCSKNYKVGVENQLNKGLKPSHLIMGVNTMVVIMVQVKNV